MDHQSDADIFLYNINFNFWMEICRNATPHTYIYIIYVPYNIHVHIEPTNIRLRNRFYYVHVLLILVVRGFEHTIHELNRRMNGLHVRRYNLRGQGKFISNREKKKYAVVWWRYATTTTACTHTQYIQEPKNSRTSRMIRIFWRENINFSHSFCFVEM